MEVDPVDDAAKIAVGAYRPLEGFLNRAQLETVGVDSLLPGAVPWPIPILRSPPGRSAAADPTHPNDGGASGTVEATP
ncbi:MAG: hypothetical protein L3K19_00760 [Thermoplasmata archaeon]|nr:hypothetical protein [Thermoplasmata archaeon]